MRLTPLAPIAVVLLLAACSEVRSLLPANALLPDGSRYRGELVDGLLQGPGRLDYPNGSWFEGQFLDGQAHGPGEWQGAAGERYRGEFALGDFHGQGRLDYRDGSYYEGSFVRGRMQGEGRLVQGGMSYTGGFVDDLYEGQGQLQWPDGASYQGQFRQGQPHGQGVRIDASGNQFTGTFEQGQLIGQGTFLSSDGDLYSGEFKHDRFHGQGRYQSSDGDVWNSQFKQGSASGEGEFKGADGSHYQGELRNWRFHGQGRLTLADGSRYAGQFAHGRFQGQGQLTLASGSQQSGIWQRGQRIRDEAGNSLPDPLEVGLLEQGRLLQEALDALPDSTPAIELYALTVAGDGKQSVFMREADYVANLLDERFAAHGRISLINHRDHLADRPVATRESLIRTVQILAERSGPEDLIFIYLTSHGSASHELHLDTPRLELNDLPARELAAALAPLKERHKVLVISACYSGGFIEPLEDDKTLIMTAARADRVSFGCSEENDFTYFGRALFAEALQQTDDLEQAFKLASTAVSKREEEDGFEASLPQYRPAQAVLKQWREWRAQQPQASTASASPARNPAPTN